MSIQVHNLQEEWYTINFESYYPCVVHRNFVERLIKHVTLHLHLPSDFELEDIEELILFQEQESQRDSIKLDSLFLTFPVEDLDQFVSLIISAVPVDIDGNMFYFVPMISFFLILSEEQKLILEKCLFSLYNNNKMNL